MKKILYTLLLSFLLVSCWESDIINTDTTKTDFFVETKKIWDFWEEIFLEKTWKLSSLQDINLSSQISWRIGKIFVKEWEKVSKWDIIWRVEDTISNYWLALERAQNALDKAQINYESTENQLNKNISDIKINLDNLKIDEDNSKSSLELEKIDNSIKKLALDFDNLKISNSQSVERFKNSI